MSSLSKQDDGLLAGSSIVVERGVPSLVGGRCRACQTGFFPAVEVCPVCGAEDISSETLPREGEIYSFTVVHVAPSVWKTPMAVGYVDLPNGVRVFAHLRGEQLQIGKKVVVDIDVVGKKEGQPVKTFVFRVKEDQ